MFSHENLIENYGIFKGRNDWKSGSFLRGVYNLSVDENFQILKVKRNFKDLNAGRHQHSHSIAQYRQMTPVRGKVNWNVENLSWYKYYIWYDGTSRSAIARSRIFNRNLLAIKVLNPSLRANCVLKLLKFWAPRNISCDVKNCDYRLGQASLCLLDVSFSNHFLQQLIVQSFEVD